MNDRLRQRFRQRMQRVIDHIHAHLDENPCADELSRLAHFSRFHFQRQFSAWFGMGVGRYVQLLRLERASQQLAYRGELRVTDIALQAGFERPETFSRAFRKISGQSPSAFRRAPQWNPWQQILFSLNSLEYTAMKQSHHLNDVRIEQFPDTPIALLVHRGAPEDIPHTLRSFIAWRKRFGPSLATSKTFNILYDDPSAVPNADFRFGIAASVAGAVVDNEQGVTRQLIPGGRCAVLRHVGPDRTIDVSVRYLYREWLETSGEELRDFPMFFHRIGLFPDVPKHQALVDIHLPLQ